MVGGGGCCRGEACGAAAGSSVAADGVGDLAEVAKHARQDALADGAVGGPQAIVDRQQLASELRCLGAAGDAGGDAAIGEARAAGETAEIVGELALVALADGDG